MAEMSHEFEINLMDYFWILWRKKWLILGFFVVAVVAAYFFASSMTPIYRTSAILMVQENDGMQNLFAGDMFSGGGNKISTYSRMIKTRSFLEEVIRRMDYRDENGELVAANVLKSSIVVTPLSGTDLVEISIQYANPEKAVEIINNLVAVFEKKNIEMNQSSIKAAREFIDLQKKSIQKQLIEAENQLLAYKDSNDIILPSEQAKQTLSKLIEIEGLKSTVEIELNSINTSINKIQQELSMQSEQKISSVVITQNALIKKYKGQIADLESKLVGLKSIYTNKHPDILRVEAEISKLEEVLNQEVEEEISSQTKTLNPVYQSLVNDLMALETNRLGSQAKLDGYKKLIREYEESLEKLPAKELEILRLERDAKVKAEIYTMLQTRAEEFKISEAMQTSDIYLVEPAYLPEHPIKPNKKMLIFMAGFLAIFVGVALILILELMDTTVKSADEVERMLQLPVLGSIPDINKMKKYYTNN